MAITSLKSLKGSKHDSATQNAPVFYSVADPKTSVSMSLDYLRASVLVVENGHVVDLGHADEVLARQPKTLE